ncbi:hypothetical protein AB1Y20_001425 [Prymnesium parvum]|uniref:Uncharacterized protein n=1 Tax=Prymnesium parvum TaxID=97485 RepID=A0AB34K9J2_PRYPA
MAVSDRVRAHLDELAQKKAIERMAMLRDRDVDIEKRERGFQVHFSGANSDASSAPSFPAFRARKPVMRVVGALPIPRGQRGQGPVENEPVKQQEPPVKQHKRLRPIPLAAPPRAAPRAAVVERVAPRQRKKWDVGQPVTVLTADGELLYMPPNAHKQPNAFERYAPRCLNGCPEAEEERSESEVQRTHQSPTRGADGVESEACTHGREDQEIAMAVAASLDIAGPTHVGPCVDASKP